MAASGLARASARQRLDSAQRWLTRSANGALLRVPLVSVLLCAGTAPLACGGGPEKPPTNIQRETPADEIMRVGKTWQSTTVDEGLLSPPDPISVFSRRLESTLRFRDDQRAVDEDLLLEESFELHDGARFQCRSSAKVLNQALFGRRSEAAAVELSRPAVVLVRACEPAEFPEPSIEVAPSKARFVMHGDQLKAFAPPLDKRIYLPIE